MNPEHLLIYVIRPVLKYLHMGGESAEKLVLGTAAVESGFKQLVQTEGPAIGIYQMEPDTRDDIHRNYLRYRCDTERKVRLLRARLELVTSDQLIGNLNYATAMCRIQYWRRPEKLPSPDDIEGLAQYWKHFYNTADGKGTTEHFLTAWADHSLSRLFSSSES